jgi:hypothetical protein
VESSMIPDVLMSVSRYFEMVVNFRMADTNWR